MKVIDLMTRGIETIGGDASATEAAKRMKFLNVGILPVMDGDRVVGVVTDRDLTIRILADPAGARWTPVIEAATRRFVSIGDDAEVDQAIDLMCTEGISRVIVVDASGQPVGVLSAGDIAAQCSSDRVCELHRVLGIKYRERHARSLSHASRRW